MSKDKATPRPWKTDGSDYAISISSVEHEDPVVVGGIGGEGEPEEWGVCDKADAELIVRSVNSHDALVKELKWHEQWLVDYFGEEDTDSGEPKKALHHIRKAIAAATNPLDEVEKK